VKTLLSLLGVLIVSILGMLMVSPAGAQTTPTEEPSPSVVTPQDPILPDMATIQPVLGVSSRLAPGMYQTTLTVEGEPIPSEVSLMVTGAITGSEEVVVTLTSSDVMRFGDEHKAERQAPNTPLELVWNGTDVGKVVILQISGPVTITIDTTSMHSEVQLVALQYNAAAPVQPTVVPTTVPTIVPTVTVTQGKVEIIPISDLVSYTLTLKHGDRVDWSIEESVVFTATFTSDMQVPYVVRTSAWMTNVVEEEGVYDLQINDKTVEGLTVDSGVATITVNFQVEDPTVLGDFQIVVYRAPAAQGIGSMTSISTTNVLSATVSQPANVLPEGGVAGDVGTTLGQQTTDNERGLNGWCIAVLVAVGVVAFFLKPR
jgi:hypothetical protein